MGLKVSFQAHCSDMFTMQITDLETGEVVHDYGPGYVVLVPDGGDDVRLEIDADSGKILNWSTIKKEVEQYLQDEDEDEDEDEEE